MAGHRRRISQGGPGLPVSTHRFLLWFESDSSRPIPAASMKSANSVFLTLVLAAFLAITTHAQTAAEREPVARMSVCEKVNALIKEHETGFAGVRGQRRTSQWLDTWPALYHLVGNDCQIWGWGRGKFSYVCDATWPNQEMAMEDYEAAKQVARECLGDTWTLRESPRTDPEGTVAEFSNPKNTTVVKVVAVSSPGLFSSEWSSYYYVGDGKDPR